MDKLTASEALYGFMAWLTTRKEEVIFSAYHNAAPAADLVKQFCETNELAEPKDHWEQNLIHPN